MATNEQEDLTFSDIVQYWTFIKSQDYGTNTLYVIKEHFPYLMKSIAVYMHNYKFDTYLRFIYELLNEIRVWVDLNAKEAVVPFGIKNYLLLDYLFALINSEMDKKKLTSALMRLGDECAVLKRSTTSTITETTDV